MLSPRPPEKQDWRITGWLLIRLLRTRLNPCWVVRPTGSVPGSPNGNWAINTSITTRLKAHSGNGKFRRGFHSRLIFIDATHLDNRMSLRCDAGNTPLYCYGSQSGLYTIAVELSL